MAAKIRSLEADRNSIEYGGQIYVSPIGMSVTEHACDVLWRLSVSTAAAHFGDDRLEYGLSVDRFRQLSETRACKPFFPPYFAVPSEQECIRRVRMSDRSNWPLNDEMIASYLNYAVDHEEPGLGRHALQQRFQVPPKHMNLMNELRDLGYVTRDDGGFRWAPPIEPVMKELLLWE
ncbi:MAG: hypothetical protein QNJ16_06280 [Rhodobacter sp.]|nr:hypothetical protein [Rhodobacter sp.]